MGWPQLAAFLDSADSFAIFRRFGNSHCRVLLHLQAEITSLEKQLRELDIHDAKTPDLHYRLRRNEHYDGWDPAQKDLLEKLQQKLSIYGRRKTLVSEQLEIDKVALILDDLLLKDTQLRALNSVPKRDHVHVFNWIWGHKPLDKGEYDFILHRNDFISSANLYGRRDGFDDFVEACISRWPQSPLTVRYDSLPPSKHK